MRVRGSIRAGLAACVGAFWVAAAAGHTLRVALPGGAAGQYGPAVRQLASAHGIGAVRLVTSGVGGFDLALLDPAALSAGCADGSLAPIDWARLGGRARFADGTTSPCGVAAFVDSLVLVSAAAKPAPAWWGDLWNVAQLPGRRALPATPVGTLEIALLADGVAPRDVYAVLSGKDGVARAFRKLDQLRPYIVWWHSEAEALRILQAGGARLAAAPADRVAAARPGVFAQQSAALQAVSAVRTVESFALAKATPGEPATMRAATTLMAAAGAAIPAGGLVVDGDFWRDHGPALRQRFAAWMSWR